MIDFEPYSLFALSSRAARFTVSPIDVKSLRVSEPTEPNTTDPELIPIPAKENKSESQIRDKKDRPILRAAIYAKADVILTGDKDFLESGLLKDVSDTGDAGSSLHYTRINLGFIFHIK